MTERATTFVSGIKNLLRLGNTNYLYSPKKLSHVREKIEGKKVIYIDGNGILCTMLHPIRVNPHANETVTALKESGYDLVLWTKASRALLSILEGKIDLGLFSEVITRENYNRNSNERHRLFQRAVKSCDWIANSVKQGFQQDCPDLKTPVLLSHNPFMFIQDSCEYSNERQGVPRNWYINLYPYGGWPIKNWRNLPVFEPSILKIIQERQIFE